jgi:c-di-AMP phosphodiesterase-like protein
MDIPLKAPLTGFLLTIISTLIVYFIFGLSSLTVVCFIIGILLTVIHFIKDEYEYYNLADSDTSSKG